jgi:TPR repeat protein
MKKFNQKILKCFFITLLGGLLFTFHFTPFSFGLDNNKLTALTEKIINSKNDEEAFKSLQEISDLYLKENKYNDFVEFLKSLNVKKKTLGPFINYFIAQTRYQQLKYLEEAQNWDEYFSQGNNYRQDITEACGQTINSTLPKDFLNLYARLILWQFHKDQEDVFAEQALADLMSSVIEYSKSTASTVAIKTVADKLSSYGEKAKSRILYKVFVDRLTVTNIKDEELVNLAGGFFREGNLDLSEAIYDVYIERILKSAKEKAIAVLTEIAKQFSYHPHGQYDLFYAEKVFAKLEEIAGKGSSNEELTYTRAYNSEKAKDYARAFEVYQDLTARFSTTAHLDEAYYKMGLISTYILRDIKTGKEYFQKLADKETISTQVISSLYQLGLLSQWEENFTKAKDYYNLLVEKAGEGFGDDVSLANERIKEIDKPAPMEYSLKTFLDLSLKEGYEEFKMAKLDLIASLYLTDKAELTGITTVIYKPESGCTQVEVQYLWSGNLGKTKPQQEQSSFDTSYLYSGAKVINLVAVTPGGVVDRDMIIIDTK